MADLSELKELPHVPIQLDPIGRILVRGLTLHADMAIERALVVTPELSDQELIRVLLGATVRVPSSDEDREGRKLTPEELASVEEIGLRQFAEGFPRKEKWGGLEADEERPGSDPIQSLATLIRTRVNHIQAELKKMSGHLSSVFSGATKTLFEETARWRRLMDESNLGAFGSIRKAMEDASRFQTPLIPGMKEVLQANQQIESIKALAPPFSSLEAKGLGLKHEPIEVPAFPTVTPISVHFDKLGVEVREVAVQIGDLSGWISSINNLMASAIQDLAADRIKTDQANKRSFRMSGIGLLITGLALAATAWISILARKEAMKASRSSEEQMAEIIELLRIQNKILGKASAARADSTPLQSEGRAEKNFVLRAGKPKEGQPRTLPQKPIP